MNKKTALSLLIVIVSFKHLAAQPMSLSVNLATSLFATGSTGGGNMGNTQNVYNLLPIIGYNHYISGNLGLGLSFGKNIQKYKITNNYENASPPNFQLSETRQTIDEKLYYIAAGIYKDYAFRAGKLYLTLALSPSFTHAYARSISIRKKETRLPVSPQYESVLIETRPDTYIYGLHFKPSFQYRLFRNFYINTYLELGVSITNIKGMGTTTFTESLDGTVQHQEVTAFQYSGLGLIKMDDVLFGIGIGYRFKNIVPTKTR